MYVCMYVCVDQETGDVELLERGHSIGEVLDLCVCVFIHKHTNECVYTYTHIHKYTYMCVYTYTYIHTHIYTTVLSCRLSPNQAALRQRRRRCRAYTNAHTHIYIHIHTYTHTHIHTHLYTYTYTYINTHKHIYLYTYTTGLSCGLSPYQAALCQRRRRCRATFMGSST